MDGESKQVNRMCAKTTAESEEPCACFNMLHWSSTVRLMDCAEIKVEMAKEGLLESLVITEDEDTTEGDSGAASSSGVIAQSCSGESALKKEEEHAGEDNTEEDTASKMCLEEQGQEIQPAKDKQEDDKPEETENDGQNRGHGESEGQTPEMARINEKPEKASGTQDENVTQNDSQVDVKLLNSPKQQPEGTKSQDEDPKKAHRLTPDFPEALYELLCTLQEGRRLNDQRCSFRLENGMRRRRCHSEPNATKPANRVIFSSMTSLQKEEFFELVATAQARRLDDQRAQLERSQPPKPKARSFRGSIKQLSFVKRPVPVPIAAPVPVPKEDLYNMILTTQMLLFLSLLIFCVPLGGDTSPISCYNDQGDAVDWFYIYKLPKDPGEKSSENGKIYLLLEKGSESWANGKVTVNDTTGALGRTVGQLYSQGKDTEVAYILYNDQRPPVDFGDRWADNSGSRGGHTKGVVLLDKNQGFWLVHSTPHFPPVQQAGEYSYPDSGVNNGQNFICVTYPLTRFQTIGEQLQINQPNVYDCDVPESLASLVPALAAVCEKKHLSGHIFPHVKTVSNRSVTLTSKDGTDFISFAKGSSFDNDLYHAWVAPTLKSNLLVQFWIRSTGILPSDCSQGWKVLDIKLINPGQTFSFKTSEDHSKWAVSSEEGGSKGGGGGGWVCVGDINRNVAEEKRGGGTVCLRDPAVWKAYRTAALECEACDGITTSC
ncbi:hypothetical protein L3Q82_013521 [Scortum barcoo]|uniref:Uncharacterized protein n=1 Tax=Scortum barcoo TaxID=214431 RepID=A0ACB8W0Y7_9TELE|nr:hypothetical protein L3Q82_013521 [Scortum barcoo]